MAGARRADVSRAAAVDTIVAPITAPGAGERAALRLSGPRALDLAQAACNPTGPLEPGRLVAGALRFSEETAAPLLLLAFRAPRSLTGEDVVEVHLPGWPPLLAEVVARLVAAGARPAARGEFTRRAVAAGRLSLRQGLAAGRLVEARDAEEAAAAAAELSQPLRARHAELREALLDALVLVEAHADFEEQDTEAVGEAELRAALERARAGLERLAAAVAAAPALDGETDVALLGPPNAGKSALFLALCPGARTTVSPVPGTTRDALEARVTRGGRRWRVLDGPGLDPRHPALGPLDRRAMELFAAQLPPRAVVLDLEDAGAPSPGPARAARAAAAGARPVVRLLSRCDLDPQGRVPDDGRLRVSALRGTGLDALWEALERAAPRAGAPDLAAAEEARATARAAEALERALAGPLQGELPLLALELREALAALDEPGGGGARLPEELLERIFAGFCIGK